MLGWPRLASNARFLSRAAAHILPRRAIWSQVNWSVNRRQSGTSRALAAVEQAPAVRKTGPEHWLEKWGLRCVLKRHPPSGSGVRCAKARYQVAQLTKLSSLMRYARPSSNQPDGRDTTTGVRAVLPPINSSNLNERPALEHARYALKVLQSTWSTGRNKDRRPAWATSPPPSTASGSTAGRGSGAVRTQTRPRALRTSPTKGDGHRHRGLKPGADNVLAKTAQTH